MRMRGLEPRAEPGREGGCPTSTWLPRHGPERCRKAPYASVGVPIVRFSGFRGLIGRIWHDDCCQTVATGGNLKRVRRSVHGITEAARAERAGVAGSYEMVERRRDGSLVLRPER